MLIGVEWTQKEQGVKVTNPQSLAIEIDGQNIRLPDIVFVATIESDRHGYFPIVLAYADNIPVMRRVFREMETKNDALQFAVATVENALAGIYEDDYHTSWTLQSWLKEIKGRIDKWARNDKIAS